MVEKIAIRLNSKDNVATLTDVAEKGDIAKILSEEGEEIDRVEVTTEAPLPFHKIALSSMDQGAEVIKYGEVIGTALEKIAKGSWIHTHNAGSAHLPEEEAL